MKYLVLLVLVFGVHLLGSIPAAGQDANVMATLQADREYNDGQFKAINARFEELLAAHTELVTAYNSLKKRMDAMAFENQKLREELTRRPTDAVRFDDLKPIDKKLREINDAREADKREILEQLDKVARAAPIIVNTPSVSHSEPPPTTIRRPDPAEKGGFIYVVKAGDNLAAIVEAYRKEGVKVTLEQVIKANPKINPDVLQVKQKIRIPDPSQP